MTHLQPILLFKDSSATTNPSAARSARCRGWALVIERASDKAAKPPGKIRHSSFRQGAGSGCRRPRSSSRKPKHGLQKRVRCSTASSPNGATWRIGLASAMMQKIKNFRTADCVVGGFLCRRRESGRFASARLVRLARVTSSRWLHFKPWPSPIDLD